MRLLLVSDLHYGLRQYDWLERVAGDFDAVIIAGDLLDLRSTVPIDAQAVAVSAQLARIAQKGTLVACSGNHDLNDRDAAGEKAAPWLQRARASGVLVDGDTVELGETLVTVCPWWDGPAGRGVLEERFVADAARERKRWAWVYHAPPAGSRLSWDGRQAYGDDALAAWIERFEPDMVITGHVHRSPFVDGGGWAERLGTTWLFNAGREPGPVPAHIVVDLAAGHATWFSSEGPESVALN